MKMSEIYKYSCGSQMGIGPVLGSDLIPLKRLYQPNMTSYNRKQQRRERHLKLMIRQKIQAESSRCNLNGMVSALLELANVNSDIVDNTLLELWRQNRPRPVEPLDYETYIVKNKVLLHNDPHRELLTFPHDDILIPAPTPSKKIRTIHSTVPAVPTGRTGNLLVEECFHTYTDTCHLVHFKYSKYSGEYQQLPNVRKSTSLPDQVFEIDAEADERVQDQESLNRSYSNASMNQITKAGWLYMGPDGGKDTVISFTRQFKRRYFRIKQQADLTYSLEFYKDDRKSESKGVIFLDCVQEVVKNPKKGKHCFEVKTPDKVYIFAAESDAEMEEWIKTLDKVRNIAETLVQFSFERIRDDGFHGDRLDVSMTENAVHPELIKCAKETERMLHKARQEGRQNLFNIYSSISKYINDNSEDEITSEIDIYPKQFGERFVLHLLEFKTKLQVNLADEGGPKKYCNPEPFFLTFCLYDAKDGIKISEDFHMNPNEDEIEAMIPPDIASASDKLHTVEGKSTAPELNGFDDKWILSKHKCGLFSVIRCHSLIYLYVKIETVLQGPISQAVEPYLKGSDPKTGSKVYRQMKHFCSNIGHHRMPYAWSAKPLSSSNFAPFEMPLYKQESSKLSHEEIIKHLQDLARPDKQTKWTTIPGTLKVSLHPIKQDQVFENTITPSYVPLKPFPIPPTNPPAVEIEGFISEKGQLCNPYDSYVNNLYVYPQSLKYDSQKTFTKARNICCCVEMRDSDDEHAVPLKSVYSRLGPSAFTYVSSTSVLHHNQTPEYMEEVKISLPPLLHEKHHLLFRFYHVSCEGSKGSSKKKEGIEVPVGYAWIPLLHSNGRVNVGENNIPVAANLPPRYLSYDQHSGKSSTGFDIKLIDCGKPLFKIKLVLNSTIYTKDQHLHMFFFHCQKMLDSSSPGHDSLNKLKVFEKFSNVADTVDLPYLMNAVKSLHAVDVSTYVQFLPTILNMLFKLVVNALIEDISMNAVRVVIHIVSEVQDADKTDLLEKYVKYIFKAEHIPKGSRQKTIHEELAKSLTMILRPANADQVVVTKFLKDSWFFFEVLVKSMTQFLIDGEKVKLPRHEHFSSDFQFKIQTLIQTIIPYIINKYKEVPKETRNANFSLAYFVKMCFTLMDRGVVFQLVNQYLHSFGVVDQQTLHEYKFEFLKIVCNHEHYIPLSLPLMRKGLIKSYKDLKSDYTLSEEYRKMHFLPGLLLQELKMALSESKETRKCAINVLRDQFAKHAFDDRYSKKELQGRIAALYLPLISILLEIKERLTKSDEKEASPGKTSSSQSVVNGDVASIKGGSWIITGSQTGDGSPFQKHKSVVSLPMPITESVAIRDSSVFDMIAGTQANIGVEDLKSIHINDVSSDTSGTVSSTDITTGNNEKSKEQGHSRQGSIITLTANPVAPSAMPKVYQKLSETEIKDLLICFLHILKYLPDDILLGWFNNSSEYDIVDFFSLLGLCLDHFKYLGKKRIVTYNVIGDSSMGRKTASLPNHRRSAVPTANGSVLTSFRSVSQFDDYPIEAMFTMTTSSETDATMQALADANVATETGMIVLDVLAVYMNKFKSELAHRDGDNTMMETVFDLYLCFLKTSQSEILQSHVFAFGRHFIKELPIVLFKGDATLCEKLCYELLRCCNSRLKSTRKEACILLYSLMKANFEFSNKSFTRVHLKMIISVSQLIGNVVTLSNHRFQESLALINSYANSDKGLTFYHEVKDLTKRIKTVMMATAQMKEHQHDQEMLIDLQYSLANSYASTPELRKTWLESMARIHKSNGHHSEAAHCYMHVAALVAEYLKKRDEFPQGCSAFKFLSPNIEKDESGIKDDSGMQDVQYTEETMVTYMEEAAMCFEQANRYEVLGDVYKLIIPMYENSREFEKLAQCYKILADAYNKVVEVMQSGKRLLGTYFRVAFFGQLFFGELDQKQYIYKEAKVTSLAEICDRLKNMYASKFGPENVKLIMDSKTVNTSELDNNKAYIQVTHVMPYFTEKEVQQRLTDFEKNNNISQFMYETPFTKDGKNRGEIHEQHKRRTILIAGYSFPYVKKRIEVASKMEYILTPIEVAIDEMHAKVADLKEVINLAMPDMKKLQLKLQGSVSAQVNAGPMAYAETFLSESKVNNYPAEKVDTLKKVFRDSLDLNAKLITTEQKEYHESLRAGLNDIRSRLSKLLGENIQIKESDHTQQASVILYGNVSASNV